MIPPGAQDVAALAIVAVAVLWLAVGLVRRIVSRRRACEGCAFQERINLGAPAETSNRSPLPPVETPGSAPRDRDVSSR